MSDRRRGARFVSAALAAALLGVGAPTAGASAQVGAAGAGAQVGANARTDAAREAELVARLDSLLARMDAIPVRDRRSRAERPVVPLDTFVVRGLRVVTPVEDAGPVGRWVGETMADIESRTGTIPVLAEPPTLYVDWAPLTASFPRGPGTIVRLSSRSADEVRSILLSTAGQLLTRALPGSVQEWLAGSLGFPAPAYRELTALPSPEVASCRQGDTGACATALGLAPADPGDASPPPVLSPSARLSFLHYLLRARPGTLERLMTGAPNAAEADAAEVDLRAVLERAAGTSLDPVIAGWRDDVLSHRTAWLPPSTLGATLLWIALGLGLAMRSTRWRA